MVLSFDIEATPCADYCLICRFVVLQSRENYNVTYIARGWNVVAIDGNELDTGVNHIQCILIK